ncbi:MAG: UDP-N-acetylmuramate dehydrogenase [Gammaproteobacteria bacterium]|nr:UDP-N-acetylmuramate dehydrogenase [Gammaproteobacteria bacterium]
MFVGPASTRRPFSGDAAVNATRTGNEVRLRGRLLMNEPMAQHSTWRVGGPADRFYFPADLDDLREFLAQLPPSMPLLWAGLGSNLLVRDGGFRGTVIALAGAIKELRHEPPGAVVADAGVACAKVARFAAAHRLAGVEFLAGIPGTVGGALAMNAGAHGSEIWDWVQTATTLDRAGALRERNRADLAVGYRHVALPDGEWFVRARLQLRPDPEATGDWRIRELLARRSATQPTGEFSCGSVFRNPVGDYAGRLIEKCGLKGMRVGAARVSEKHANFIINEGGATAAHLEQLIGLIRNRVREQCNVDLDPEVRIVGEPAQ